MTCALQDLAGKGKGGTKVFWSLFFLFVCLFYFIPFLVVLIWSNPRHFNSSMILYTCLVALVLLHETFIWKGLF